MSSARRLWTEQGDHEQGGRNQSLDEIGNKSLPHPKSIPHQNAQALVSILNGVTSPGFALNDSLRKAGGMIG